MSINGSHRPKVPGKAAQPLSELYVPAMDVHLAHCCTNCADIRVRLCIPDKIGVSDEEQDISLHALRHHQPQIELKVADKSLTTSASHSATSSNKKKKQQVAITEIHACLSPTDCRLLLYRCVIHHLQPGTSYTAKISCSKSETNETSQTEATVSFATLDDNDLGRRHLRIGILTDLHINNHKRASDGKRLYKSAKMLAAKYLKKMICEHRVDRIVLPGDVCDTGSIGELHAAANILKTARTLDSRVGTHAIIGNHEADKEKFAEILVPEGPKTGYYSITASDSGVHLIMLATDKQNSLDKGTAQLEWLQKDLEAASVSSEVDIIILFMHYSLILHSLHNEGAWDDGLQLLDNSEYILKLIHSHSKVKTVICGHKNVPSILVDHSGVLHTLSPQLIQTPCAYDIFDVYDHGLLRTVHEIEEMDLQEVARNVAGEKETNERRGEEKHRAIKFMWLR